MVTPLVTGIWFILGTCLGLLIVGIAIRLLVQFCVRRKSNEHTNIDNAYVFANMYTYDVVMAMMYRGLLVAVLMSKGVVLVLLLFMLLGLGVSNSRLLTYNQQSGQVSGQGAPVQLFFIPKSSQSLHSLDQGLALGMGSIVLWYAVRSAWKVRAYTPAGSSNTPLRDLVALLLNRRCASHPQHQAPTGALGDPHAEESDDIELRLAQIGQIHQA